MIGDELGGRYEIMARIGGGGMALVYKAHDKMLGRNVAIKVLRQQYVHDEDFIRRFRREAQAAASLSHPNVVSVYDVGQQDDVHYIVMEYIEGINLNEKIGLQAPLQVEEAVHIASQICDALEHAHSNQVIHRDIKPHNILIGKNGRVKVTDFGIARAAASSQITQTGAVLGSVHYFSPEHAKGAAQGAKSDLYSLGIVLYQMLTGKLPFSGESPISVALKHLQEDIEEPRKYNLLIPQSVENVVMRSVRKRPDERYQSAREMLGDLETCLAPERRNEPRIAFPASPVDEFDDDQNTRIMPAIRSERRSVREEMPTRSANEGPEDVDPRKPWAGLDEPKGKPWIKPLVWFGITIILLLMMWYGVSYVKEMLKIPEVDVPTVIGKQVDEAVRILTAEEFIVAEPIEEKFSKDAAKGIVLDQDKLSMRVKKGSTIKLTVSKGKQTAEMPSLIGKTWTEAELELRSIVAQERVKRQDEYSELPQGTVFKQSPEPGEEFDPETDTITLYVSQGSETIEMPNLIGEKESVAESILIANNLVLDKKSTDQNRKPSYKAPKGYVFDQWPYEPGKPVKPGSEIILYISDGYPDDAVQYMKLVTVSPSEPGVKTTIKIAYSDARGENIDWGTFEITETKTYPIPLVLSSTKNAVITIKQNDSLKNAITVTREEALNLQGGPESEPEPEAENDDTDEEILTPPEE